jgi:hypothetical protein
VNALRNLKYYRRSLENRENVTDDEYQTLASIIDTVRELQQLLQMED